MAGVFAVWEGPGSATQRTPRFLKSLRPAEKEATEAGGLVKGRRERL